MSDFYLRDDAYSEPYYPPQWCGHCGVLLDGYTKPEDHEPLCPHHPDSRHDLDELDEVVDTEDGEVLAVLKGAA